jgi:hypothetical protein
MTEPAPDFLMLPEWTVKIPNGPTIGTVHRVEHFDAVRYVAMDLAGTLISGGDGWTTEPAGRGYATPEEAARALYQRYQRVVPSFDRLPRGAAEHTGCTSRWANETRPDAEPWPSP